MLLPATYVRFYIVDHPSNLCPMPLDVIYVAFDDHRYLACPDLKNAMTDICR